MPTVRANSTRSPALTLLTIVAVVAVLYWTREVAIPLAVAILLSFLLAPLVIRVQRLGVGRIGGVLVVTALAFAFLALLGYIVTGQVVQLANNLPQYKDNIRQKIQAIQPRGGLLQRATESLKQVSEEVMRPDGPAQDPPTSPTPPAAGPESQPPPSQPQSPTTPDTSQPRPNGYIGPPTPSDAEAPQQQPVPVTITQRPPNTMGLITGAIGPILNQLVSVGIVIVFVVFMLIMREDLRDRVIRLIGEGRITVTTKAIDEAGRLVSRYLLMQLVVNATYGIPVMIGLYLIGVPNALLWGLLSIVLRYLPYIGPWIAASMPIALSLAVFDDWTRPLMVIGFFIVLEIISNNVIEPWLYGSGTGVSAMAILVSAVFWTWLWGPIGLMLATPLTVCAMVVGRYVPQLGFLNILLSDRPSLTPQERVYQRLLAMDHDEAFSIVEELLKERSLLDVYDSVLVPALVMAERDRHNGVLDEVSGQAVCLGLRSLLEELEDRAIALKAKADESDPNAAAEPQRMMRAENEEDASAPPRVICIPARDEADELTAIMLVQLLRLEGISAQSLSIETLSGEVLDRLEKSQPATVCISATPPMAVTPSRSLCKRLSTRLPKLPIVVGVWSASDLTHARERIGNCGGNVKIVSSFAQAIERTRT